MKRRTWLRSVTAGFVATLPDLGRSILAQEAPYRSPYSLKFRHPVAELEVGFDRPPGTIRSSKGITNVRAGDAPEVEEGGAIDP